MSNIFQLVDRLGRVANIEWQYLIDEGSLQKFENKVKSLPSQQWSQLDVSKKEAMDAIRMLRSAPKVSPADFPLWMTSAVDPVLAASKWAQGLYAWPTPTAFSQSPTPPPHTSDNLSFDRGSEIWEGLDDMLNAYEVFIKTTGLLWKKNPYQVFGDTCYTIDMHHLNGTAKAVSNIKNNSITPLEVSPLSGLWDTQCYVVYVAHEDQEGYLGTSPNGVSGLANARSFSSVNAAKKAGKKATTYGGAYYVFEQSKTVGRCVHVNGSEQRSRMSSAIAQRNNEQLSAEVEQHVSTKSLSTAKKSRM